MERERRLPPQPLMPPRATHPEFENEDDDRQLEPDPNAPPPLSHWPPIPELAGVSSSAAPGPPNLPQTVGTQFKAMGLSDTGAIPPDSMGDVGPTQVLVHTNGRIRVYSKAGVLGALNSSTGTFWSSVAGGAGFSDPMVRYDRLSGRWFVIGITINPANNRILLAVSSGPTITGAASFTFFQFNIGTVTPSEAGSFCDYPGFGVDANALYVGCNMFGGAFHITAYVIRKSTVTGAPPMVVTGFALGVGPYSPARRGQRRSRCDGGVHHRNGYQFPGPDQHPKDLEPGRGPDDRLDDHARGLEHEQLGSVREWLDHPHQFAERAAVLREDHQEQAHRSVHAVDGAFRRDHHDVHPGRERQQPPPGREVVPDLEHDHDADDHAVRHALHDRNRSSPRATQSADSCSQPWSRRDKATWRSAASYASSTEFVGVAAAGRLRTDPAGGTRAPETIVLAGSAVVPPSRRHPQSLGRLLIHRRRSDRRPDGLDLSGVRRHAGEQLVGPRGAAPGRPSPRDRIELEPGVHRSRSTGEHHRHGCAARHRRAPTACAPAADRVPSFSIRARTREAPVSRTASRSR